MSIGHTVILTCTASPSTWTGTVAASLVSSFVTAAFTVSAGTVTTSP